MLHDLRIFCCHIDRGHPVQSSYAYGLDLIKVGTLPKLNLYKLATVLGFLSKFGNK